MKCTLCGKPVMLIPSATERASKDVTGRPASFYTALFTTHAACVLEKRAQDTTKFMQGAKL